MDKFEASNGRVIGKSVDHLQHVSIYFGADGAGGKFVMAADEYAALREFFRAERDEELGRWRYPKDPQFVVYPGFSPGENSRVARVVHEHVGTSTLVYEKPGIGRTSHPAATAYFEAHPERKPWHDAKEGEVWVLTLDGDEIPYMARPSMGNNVYFEGVIGGIKPNSTMITAGRRIYPEASDES